MCRRISTWERRGGYVFGKALQDLGDDCYAVYCTAFVYDATPGEGHWTLVLERACFAPQIFHAKRRAEAMMLAEHIIAKQWSPLGIRALVAANPDAFAHPTQRPGPVPVTDCKKYPFWKPRPVIGPQDLPRYMKNLPAELVAIAKSSVFDPLDLPVGDEDDPML